MDKKLIFLDIDGTLTIPGSNVPPDSALEAIRKARSAGHRVFLCTGRNPAMLRPLLKYPFDGYVGSGGGYIVCGDEVIYDCPMTEDQRQAALQILQNHGIYRTVECRDGSYTDESFKEFLREHAGEGGNSELLRWREQVEKSLDIRPMAEYRGEPVYKIVMMFRDMDQIREPEKVLGGDFSFVIQDQSSSGIINGELVNRAFDKGKGVLRVCGYYGCGVEDTIGFGDSNNDREMLETVGISVCMENGSPEMKKISDRICPAVDQDGLAKAFADLGLI